MRSRTMDLKKSTPNFFFYCTFASPPPSRYRVLYGNILTQLVEFFLLGDKFSATCRYVILYIFKPTKGGKIIMQNDANIYLSNVEFCEYLVLQGWNNNQILCQIKIYVTYVIYVCTAVYGKKICIFLLEKNFV